METQKSTRVYLAVLRRRLAEGHRQVVRRGGALTPGNGLEVAGGRQKAASE